MARIKHAHDKYPYKAMTMEVHPIILVKLNRLSANQMSVRVGMLVQHDTPRNTLLVTTFPKVINVLVAHSETLLTFLPPPTPPTVTISRLRHPAHRSV